MEAKEYKKRLSLKEGKTKKSGGRTMRKKSKVLKHDKHHNIKKQEGSARGDP